MIPETISHYRILNKLGAGGMGEVYLAEDVRLGRKVALKLLPPDLTNDEHRLRRFRQEARAASALNHPNILTIYDIGETDSLHFIATEFVKGVTLRKRMSSAKMTLQEALDVTIQVAGALSAAHQAGIVHRDIKPENIMIRPDGYVKVLDFGLAKLIEQQAPLRDSARAMEPLVTTEPGLVMGTPKYMSPEQVRGLSVDGRTDIFSLGVVLYEMITGRAPFEGPTISDVIAAILQKKPLPVSQYLTGAPIELQQIVSKALFKEREKRYQEIDLLLSELKKLRQQTQMLTDPGNTTQTGLSIKATLPIGNREPEIKPSEETEAGTSSASFTTPPLRARQVRRPINSLAILPLANASADPGLEYLSDGITETIINRLSKLPKLKVMARSTVFRYKGKQADPLQVGHELHVRAVLTGRVLLLGNRLIISTELVDAVDGSQLWGEQYSRELSDIFVIGGEISKKISDKLRLKLTGEQQKRLTKRYTENTEAYQLYLKGRYFLNRFFVQTIDVNDLKAAEGLFKESIETDPDFALAHSSLGNCYINYVLKGIGGVEYYSKAKEALDRALELDSKLVESRVHLSFIDLFVGSSDVAREEIRHLIQIAPNEPSVYFVAQYIYRLSGQYERALEMWDCLLKINPTDVVIASYNRSRIYKYQRDYAKAEAEIEKGFSFEPNHPLLHAYSSMIFYYQGDSKKAAMILEEVLSKNEYFHTFKTFLAYCYLARGEKERALKLVDNRVIETCRADQDGAYWLASVCPRQHG